MALIKIKSFTENSDFFKAACLKLCIAVYKLAQLILSYDGDFSVVGCSLWRLHINYIHDNQTIKQRLCKDNRLIVIIVNHLTKFWHVQRVCDCSFSRYLQANWSFFSCLFPDPPLFHQMAAKMASFQVFQCLPRLLYPSSIGVVLFLINNQLCWTWPYQHKQLLCNTVSLRGSLILFSKMVVLSLFHITIPNQPLIVF